MTQYQKFIHHSTLASMPGIPRAEQKIHEQEATLAFSRLTRLEKWNLEHPDK